MKNESVFKKYKLEDLCNKPKFFDTEEDGHAKLSLVDFYGILYPQDKKDERPIWFIRHCNPDAYRFGGVFKAGDGPFGLQEPLHLDDMAQKDTKINHYSLKDDAYEISSDSPFSQYRIYEDHVTLKEDGVYDLTAELFPFAIFKHADDTMSVSQITQTVLYEGQYEGKPVKGIGNVELCLLPENENRNYNDFWSYIYAFDTGIREDGRKEFAMVRFSLDGGSTGIYWLEGEEPIVSNDVKMEADWYHLPYEDDGTCCYKDAVWSFGGKKINFKGKWGHKGLTAYPRMELKGQSQIMGEWYEGDTEYKHTVSMTFHENMDVYDKNLIKAGMKVVD